MKRMKRSAALVLALVMVFSMTVTVSAAGSGSITIDGAQKDQIYEIYRIFDLTMAENGAVAYTINENWTDFFANAGAGYIVDANSGTLNPITVDGVGKYINITDSNVAEFSRAAQIYAVNLTPDDSAAAGEEGLSFTGLDLGYYLVYPQGATDVLEGYACICSLTSTVPDAQVKVKAETPTITKTDDAVSADLGQTVNYTITGQVPDTTGFTNYEYTVEDTMSDGLTFQKDVAVTFGGTAIEVEADYTAIPNGFRVSFDMTQYQQYVGKEILITYSAVVNENAVVKDKVEKNKATLTYSNNPKDWKETDTTPPVEEEVYSSQIVIDKVDGANVETKLAGAEFILQNDEGKYYNLTSGVVTWVEKEKATAYTTDDNGTAAFKGLKDGTYYLVETKAPDGYNLLPDPVEVKIRQAGENQISISHLSQVANHSGTTLPSTGGSGTMLFYTLGGLLVLAASVLLITKKRMGTL